MSNLYPLEVVGRGSETQLQVWENLDYITQRCICVLCVTCHLCKLCSMAIIIPIEGT